MDGVVVVAAFGFEQRQVVNGIGPIRGEAHGCVEGIGCLLEALPGARAALQLRNAQRIVSIGAARIDAYGLVQQVFRVAVSALAVENQRAAVAEERAALIDRKSTRL